MMSQWRRPATAQTPIHLSSLYSNSLITFSSTRKQSETTRSAPYSSCLVLGSRREPRPPTAGCPRTFSSTRSGPSAHSVISPCPGLAGRCYGFHLASTLLLLHLLSLSVSLSTRVPAARSCSTSGKQDRPSVLCSYYAVRRTYIALERSLLPVFA